ncbi:MAG: hypothetical protein MRJ96_11550 [Nitrospirales bacterium]|nr:hypothetical protein [Nitrospira sp.]MDR4502074.1 hypothetical protein [Nitrospirales bacterium]
MSAYSHTQQAIRQIFRRLDYRALAPIYCDEGGEAFWQAHRQPCQRLGMHIARYLKSLLAPKGRSLYVGAGVAEIPPLLMEILELDREPMACNLRTHEVHVLNQACGDVALCFHSEDAQEVHGEFDHIWIVSVLNDPERFPELSALSYGRANPVHFDTRQFQLERETVLALTHNCLQKLTIPGLVTTSIEEIPWIANWCNGQNIPYSVGEEDHPTAIVQDPICFIRVG